MFRQARRNDMVRLSKIILELVICNFASIVLLYPLEASRGQVRGRPVSRLVSQDLEIKLRSLEAKCWLPRFLPPADRKYFSPNFPYLRITPLYDIGCRRESLAKFIEFIVVHSGSSCHFARRTGLSGSVSGKPVSQSQALYFGRLLCSTCMPLELQLISNER